MAYALANATLVHQFCQEAQRTRERAEAVIAFATEQGFPHWKHWGTALRGWALAAQDQGEVGIPLLHQGLAALAALNVRLARPYLLALLADAYGRTGRIEEGLTTLAEALTQVHDTGERYYEAELYRLKGELTLQGLASRVQSTESKRVQSQGQKSKVCKNFQIPNPQSQSQEEAEACFLKAIEIARNNKRSH